MRVPHIRFLLLHALGGVAVGLGATLLLVWLDVGRLGTLAAASPEGSIALALLGFGFSVTFGSAAIGAAIMGEAGQDEPGPPRARALFPPKVASAPAGFAAGFDHRSG
ncbi:MAG: hypothetical protein IT556_10000 [Acetobacteraceae bacterium]|nr:hypothetical protein [Acetobacteraceae bacterium]